MESRFTSSSAKAFLLEQLLAQAALDEFSFSDIEQRLLREGEERTSNSVSEKELEEFELARRDEFFENVAVLLQRAWDRFEEQYPNSSDFADAIYLAKGPDDYFSIILVDKFPSHFEIQNEPRTLKGELTTLGIGLAVCAVLIGTIYILEDNETQWARDWQRFLSHHPTIAGLHLPYFAWLQNPNGWFQQNGGKYFVTAAVAFGIVYWGRSLWRFIARRT